MTRAPFLRRRRGLTLVELLVSLLIFGLVAAAAAASLRLALDARDQLDAAARRTAALETLRLVLSADLASVVQRAPRDQFGDAEAPFLGGTETRRRSPVAGETLLLAFVRDGWANPENAAPRSSLQHVEYLVRGTALVRRSRPYVDDARGQKRLERVLLPDVRDVSVEFLGKEGTGGAQNPWLSGWPVGSSANRPPRAVVLVLTTPKTGVLRQAFWIGEVGGPPSEGPSAAASTKDGAETTAEAEDGAAEPVAEPEPEPEPAPAAPPGGGA